ncbi:hypothetical protein [Streptomyces sp. NPDC006477]|uniref:hypothetical protein n=1 Tax=Streptomyces sp. NPDC006477 TaxID=3364747 RepID=UPI0036A866D4
MGLFLSRATGRQQARCLWFYSGFAAFRRRMAETEGFVLSEMRGFGGERRWNEVSIVLQALLNRPDAGGDDLSPAACASVLIRLEVVLDQRAREGGDQLIQQYYRLEASVLWPIAGILIYLGASYTLARDTRRLRTEGCRFCMSDRSDARGDVIVGRLPALYRP